MLPLEFVTEVFISPLKGLLAHELAERGYSQSRVGQLLGISQPAVSSYLKNPKNYYEEKLLKVLDKRQLQSLVRAVLALIESSPQEEVIRYINNYSISLLSSLKLCQLHKATYPQLQNCEICKDIQVYTETARRVESAFEILRNCANCYKLVPKVLMNIVELGPEGGVGYPGRIYVEGTQLTVRERPRPGASRFLTKLLEEVNALWPEVKAVANVVYAAKTCVEEKMTTAEVGPSNSEEDIIKNVVSVFKMGIRDVVYDKGGRGIEPNAYVFGRDAIDVAGKILEISKCINDAR
ncbi:MAG: thiamine-phosphate synthase family protein [Pyrobaculum sp.]